MTRLRPGFTLMEMLIVIVIVVTLAGLLIPALGMARRKLNDAACGNNLRELGIGLFKYQEDHDGTWAPSLYSLGITANGIYERDTVKSLCRCKYDFTWDDAGKMNLHLNRESSDWGNPRHDLWENETRGPESDRHGCSYAYEMSSTLVIGDAITKSHFYIKKPPTEPRTWAQAKTYFQRNGWNGNPSSPRAPWPKERFPVVRCFWHYTWESAADLKNYERVQNLMMGYSVGWNIPYWEVPLRNDTNEWNF